MRQGARVLGAGLILAACAHRSAAPPLEPAGGAPSGGAPATTAPDAGVATAELEGLPIDPGEPSPASAAGATTGDAATLSVVGAEALPDAGPTDVALPLSYPVPIDDPGGQALAPLYAALARAERGEGQARLLFYGASHTASDLYTDLLRRRLQQRFGEAGPGFVMPAKPWRWYRHGGFAYEPSRNWKPVRVLAASPKPDSYGLAGVALDAGERFAVAAMTAQAHAELNGQVSRFELYYQLQPNGGRLAVFVDGQRVRSLSTAAEHAQPAYAEFLVEDGVHRFELRSQGNGPVRVFGVAAERAVPGVVLDTLGIPGSRAAYQLQWNDPLYREHLARRNPDLVALAYGTNEAGDDDVPIESYAASLRAVLVRIREVVPKAACLLIGPTDRPLKLDDGTFTVRPRLEAINAVQRSLAQEQGCAFFDTLAFMGGPLSMTRWVAAVPPLGAPDYVHFTRRGYELMGEALLSALLSGYPPPPPPVASLGATLALPSAPGASQTPAAAPCSTACR